MRREKNGIWYKADQTVQMIGWKEFGVYLSRLLTIDIPLLSCF